MQETRPLQSIPDDELLRRLADLMGQSRRIEADVVAHIGEVEERRLYAREAFPSMIAPKPDAPAVVRKLPERRMASSGLPGALNVGETPTPELRPDRVGIPVVPAFAPPVAPALVQPLSPGRYKVQFTASTELHDKLERLRALMGGRGQDDDLAAVIEQAVTEKLERLEARHFARTSAPRKGATETEARHASTSRHIPAAVRREVSLRDGGQCRYADAQGRRCPERNNLQFHHRHPFGLSGGHSLSNISLTCRAHNAFLAECDYGTKAMARHRRPQGGTTPTAADQAG